MTHQPPRRIFHIATRADWVEARRTGTYTTSTVGRSLEDEGFIHASRREQVADVFARHYSGVREPLVLLTIDADRLDAEVRDEQVGEDTFPHIHGPITPAAVVHVVPLDRHGRPESFAGVFLKEMLGRIAVAVLVMLAAIAGSAVARASGWGWEGAPLAGAALGAAVGVVVAVFVGRARRA